MRCSLDFAGQIVLLLLAGKSFLWIITTARNDYLSYRILDLVAFHDATMPLHIACMYHLSYLHSKLFVLAHELVDKEPENPISWYAVGVYYLGSNKWSQARQYFRLAFVV